VGLAERPRSEKLRDPKAEIPDDDGNREKERSRHGGICRCTRRVVGKTDRAPRRVREEAEASAADGNEERDSAWRGTHCLIDTVTATCEFRQPSELFLHCYRPSPATSHGGTRGTGVTAESS